VRALLNEQNATMSLCAKYVLPRLINLAMRNKDVTRLRAESVPQARGEVLEIGIGSGLNFPFSRQAFAAFMASIHQSNSSEWQP